MRVVILCVISVLISCNAEDCVHVRGKPHRKEILLDDVDRPYQLSIDKQDHRIFFSYNVGEEELDHFQLAYIQKDEKGLFNITGVKNGFATAVDDHHDLVYLGGSNGVYEYYPHKNESKRIIAKKNIWDLYYKNELYFIVFPRQHLYKYNTRKSGEIAKRVEHITEQIYQFVIDGDEDVFITNSTGLYMIKNNTSHRKLIHGETEFRAVAVNNKGEAHFCGQNAIYVVDKKEHKLEEIAHIDNIFGLVFGKEDHIIYSDPYSIIKLLPEGCK